MNLYGWDTVSVASVARINRALAAGQDHLITSFDFSQGGLQLRGRFGPWRILPGIAGAFLNVELPLAQAQAKGLPGAAGETDVSGLSVVVQVALKLLPSTDGHVRELRFDLIGSGPTGGQVVRYVEVRDPRERLSVLARTLVGEAVAACVAAHGDSVAFVFARIGGISSGSGWLEPSESDWCYVEVLGGQPYLAILSVVGRNTAAGLPRAVDPGALQSAPAGLLAVSSSATLEGTVLPHVQRSWFRDMRPRFNAGQIVCEVPKHLPTQTRGPFFATPHIDTMTMSLAGDGLVTRCAGHCDMSLWTRLDYTVTTTMRFVFDTVHKVARFSADPNPQVTHTMHLPGVLDLLVGWIVRWIVSFFTEQISAPIQAVAGTIQRMTSPPVNVVGWLSVTFDVTSAELSDCMVFRDEAVG